MRAGRVIDPRDGRGNDGMSDEDQPSATLIGDQGKASTARSTHGRRAPAPLRCCRGLEVDRFARSVSHLLRALETFQALGIEFVSLSEQLDTSTPTGKMVFTVVGTVAELKRSLIVERVKAGLRNARAKGKRLGRPRKVVDAAKIAMLRAQGRSWRDCGLRKSPADFSHALRKFPRKYGFLSLAVSMRVFRPDSVAEN